MGLNFFLLLFYYFTILASILGFGFFFQRHVLKNEVINLGFIGLYGFFFLTIYSYFSHYFTSHNLTHNLIVFLVGIFFFIRNLKKIPSKNLFLIILICLILFFGLLIFKTHDDFPYYHFPYTYYLINYSTLFGVGQFNHGFRTPSSIFYLNSLYYLPFIKYFTFYIPTVLFMGFSNYVLLDDIKNFIKRKNFNYIFYFSLFFFIFINIFFYRFQEHGTDRSAQIIIGLLFIQIFKFIEFDKNFEVSTNHILIFLGLIISLKSFYILYLTLIFPIVWILHKEKKINIFFNLFKNKLFYYFLFLILLILSIYIINTGCLIYPIPFTCFENFDWSIGVQQTKEMNQHYQLWSKAGKTPNFQVPDYALYLEDFNWVSNWVNLYFFNKVSDFILGLTILIGIIYLMFRNNIKKNQIKRNNTILIYLTVIILFVEWFLNHPALRYGGYILITLLLILPISLKLEKFNNSYNNIFKKTVILVLITVIIFFARNSIRIKKEIDEYGYKPFKISFYKVEESFFRVDNEFKNLINNYNNCLIDISNCDLEQFKKVKKNNNKYIFVND